MSKPNIDLNNQEITFSNTNTTPNPTYTGVVVQIKNEGSMSNGPAFQSVKSISQFVNGKLHGDSYINESTSRETYTITAHDAGNLVSENTFKGGSNNIREFRENDFDENPNSLLDNISFSSHDFKPSIDSELPTKVIDGAEVTKRSYSTNINIPTSRTNTPIKIHTDISTQFRISGADQTTESKNNFSNVYFTIGKINLKNVNAIMAEDLTRKFIEIVKDSNTDNINSALLVDSLVRDFEERYSSELANFTRVNESALNINYITTEEFDGADGWQSIDSFRNKQLTDAQNRDFELQTMQLPTLNEILQLSYPNDKNIASLEKPAYPDGESITTSDWYKKTNDIPRKSPEYHFLTHYFNELTSIPTNKQSTKSKYILDEFNAFKAKINNTNMSDINKSILESSMASDIIQNTDLEPTYCTNSNTVELVKYKLLDIVSKDSFQDKLDEIKTTYTGSLSMPNDPDNNLSYIFDKENSKDIEKLIINTNKSS
jgi:hypothetical protein